MATKPIRSIAIIDPIGDFGIGGYVYELAEGLSANGVRVDVYTNGRAQMKDLQIPRHHRILPVLGGLLLKQRKLLQALQDDAGSTARLKYGKTSEAPAPPPRRTGLTTKIGNLVLPFELALYLKKQNYDLVWTQWPVMTRYGIRFWSFCKALGMRLVHTVHNVLPHEETDDETLLRTVYGYSDALIVHSEYSRQELLRLFPECRSKIRLARFGLYTMFPRIKGKAEALRRRLDISSESRVLLCYGSVRPYKNIDGILAALGNGRCRNTVLVIAGRELGFPDQVRGEPLGRSRQVAASLGALNQVRFIPGMLDLEATSELFDAADILLLPYLKSYGSAVLLLGMTFGLYIVATRTGGMDEYLRGYPAHTLIDGPDAESIAGGIEKAVMDVSHRKGLRCSAPSKFEWRAIAKQTLQDLETALRRIEACQRS